MKRGRTAIVLLAIIAVIGGSVAIYYASVGSQGSVPAASSTIIVPYSPGEFFLTNVMGSKSLLKCDIVLEIMCEQDKNRQGEPVEGALDALKAENHKVRDCIIERLRLLTEEDIRDPDAQEILRGELTRALSDYVGIDNLINIYFNDFVMQ